MIVTEKHTKINVDNYDRRKDDELQVMTKARPGWHNQQVS